MRLSLQQHVPPSSFSLLRLLLRLKALVLGVTVVILLFRRLVMHFRRIILRPTGYTTGQFDPALIQAHQRRIVLSDLHMGGGDLLDDFQTDAIFVRFVDQYVKSDEPTDLILAGDTFEFLQIRLPDLRDDEYSDSAARQRMEAILEAHRPVIEALARFIAQPRHCLTILVGNHDFELHFPSARQCLREALGVKVDDLRLRFGLHYHGGGVYIVHGNQFDPWNRFVHFDGVSEPFEMIRGSQLVKEVINDLEDDPLPFAHLIDNIKPSSALFWYLLALPRLRNQASRRFLARGVTGFLQVVAWPASHQLSPIGVESLPEAMPDLPILHRLWAAVVRFRRGRVARRREVARQVSNVAGAVNPSDEVLLQLQSEATRQIAREQRTFSDQSTRAMLEIARRPAHQHDTLFVCGHTHLARIVPLGLGQFYVNTGSWTEIILDIATMRRQEQRFPFLEVTYPQGSRPVGRLLVWDDTDRIAHPWHEEVTPVRGRAVRP
ncbi:UDP-2,3-diacylglucosamine hydrolase [Candidatus Chloroploca asiatica]|uniref:UDP-2,3-diacylglucosamine hydrolase n=1 Tax=Candidatus Chloroploca asiatica TaxID=1506545 RepID=A0A2H3L2I2_9CHLR|nr:UDP-2,3-diacylglucosamine hydrolase [Candidatus Chloroploca asiatica]